MSRTVGTILRKSHGKSLMQAGESRQVLAGGN
jgi:hypothetical protein